ncbi:hypothetical protein H072_8798 [Dactylellina haptotyla CBS 200.50]|uniref:Copper acquisition factor BIM1-like domain-containing protein n=1 Tax=Dactylellina haptotyla (strain CBS 200.50) TaxID=1284197 RepID=S8A8S2_DACHA|nr:hypothetical protein H072_8798 [Dactylellina haptotyla CBS 200.50]
MLSKIVYALPLFSLVSGHFFLQSPPSIGFDDEKLIESPCGGFSPTDRSGGVTNWPVAGYPFSVITTHLNVVWTFKAALLSDPTNFVDIYPNVHQTGVSEFCLPALPGIEAWVGQDAVFQAIQQAPDGFLHQCSAIKFVTGGPASPGSSCSNSTTVTATTVAGTGPKPPSTQGSSSSSTSTTTPIRSSTTSAVQTTSAVVTVPTEAPSSASSDGSGQQTTAESSLASTSSDLPIEQSTGLPDTTPGSYSTALPTYGGSPTLTANVSTSAPTLPAYTGAASDGKGISFVAVLFGLVAWTFRLALAAGSLIFNRIAFATTFATIATAGALAFPGLTATPALTTAATFAPLSRLAPTAGLLVFAGAPFASAAALLEDNPALAVAARSRLTVALGTTARITPAAAGCFSLGAGTFAASPAITTAACSTGSRFFILARRVV